MSLTFFLYKAGDLTGVAKVSIDGKEVAVINGSGLQTWGGYAKTIVFGEDLPFGKHQVIIELLTATAAQNTVKGFDIIALGYGKK